MLPFSHSPTSEIIGSWPFVQQPGTTPTVRPNVLETKATILGIKRNPTTGVGGKTMHLWVDDAATGRPVKKTIAFLAGDDTLAEFISRINTVIGETVAFDDNGFLRLQSPRTGEKSYLKTESDAGSEDVFYGLGLFSGLVARGGDLRQAQHIDPKREVALPGQMAMSWGEDLTPSAINRGLLRQALNIDRLHGLLDRKRVATKKLHTAQYQDSSTVSTANRTLQLKDVVFTGKMAVPTVEELIDLVAVLDNDGNEITQEHKETLNTMTATLTFAVEADTKKQLVTVTGGATPFLSTDVAQEIYVEVSDFGGANVLNNVPLKIIEYRSTSQVVVQNTDPVTGNVIEANESGRVGKRLKMHLLRAVVDGFFKENTATTRVEALRQKVNTTGAGTVARIELNNRVYVADATFKTNGVSLGDIVRWTGAVPNQPYSNNGYYRVAGVIDERTLELASGYKLVVRKPTDPVSFVNGGAGQDTITRAVGSFVDDGFVAGQLLIVGAATNPANNGKFEIATVAALTLTLVVSNQLTASAGDATAILDGIEVQDEYGPVYLNPDTSGALGSIEVLTDGEFWNEPWARLASVDLTNGWGAVPTTGQLLQLVYLRRATVREATEQVDLFAGLGPRFSRDTTTDVQRAIMRVVGPSVKSFSEVLYGQNWNSIESVDFRLDKEHDVRGRHTTIRPDKIDMFPGVVGETFTARAAGSDLDTTVKLALRDVNGAFKLRVTADGSIIIEDTGDAAGTADFAVVRASGLAEALFKSTTNKSLLTLWGINDTLFASPTARDGQAKIVLTDRSTSFPNSWHIAAQYTSGSGRQLLRFEHDNLGANPGIVMDNDGRLGIGIHLPGVPLHIKARSTGESEQLRIEGFQDNHETLSVGFYPQGTTGASTLYAALQLDKDVPGNEWQLNLLTSTAMATASGTTKAPLRVVVGTATPESLRVDDTMTRLHTTLSFSTGGAAGTAVVRPDRNDSTLRLLAALDTTNGGYIDLIGGSGAGGKIVAYGAGGDPGWEVASDGDVGFGISPSLGGKIDVNGKQIWRAIGDSNYTLHVHPQAAGNLIKSLVPDTDRKATNFDVVSTGGGTPAGTLQLVLRMGSEASPSTVVTIEQAAIYPPSGSLISVGKNTNPFDTLFFRYALATGISTTLIDDPSGRFLITYADNVVGSSVVPRTALKADLDLNGGAAARGNAAAIRGSLKLTAGTYSDVGNTVACFNASFSSVNAAFSSKIVAGYWLNKFDLGAGSAVVDQYGVFIEDWPHRGSGVDYAIRSTALHPSRFDGSIELAAPGFSGSGAFWRLSNTDRVLRILSNTSEIRWAFDYADGHLTPGGNGTQNIGSVTLPIATSYMKIAQFVSGGQNQGRIDSDSVGLKGLRLFKNDTDTVPQIDLSATGVTVRAAAAFLATATFSGAVTASNDLFISSPKWETPRSENMTMSFAVTNGVDAGVSGTHIISASSNVAVPVYMLKGTTVTGFKVYFRWKAGTTASYTARFRLRRRQVLNTAVTLVIEKSMTVTSGDAAIKTMSVLSSDAVGGTLLVNGLNPSGLFVSETNLDVWWLFVNIEGADSAAGDQTEMIGVEVLTTATRPLVFPYSF